MIIGEAAQHSGVSAKMIRYYEDIGLITKSQRSKSGYRNYNKADIHTLHFIKLARDVGFSIERIRLLLAPWTDRTLTIGELKSMAFNGIAEIDDQISKLAELRDVLFYLTIKFPGKGRPRSPAFRNLV